MYSSWKLVCALSTILATSSLVNAIIHDPGQYAVPGQRVHISKHLYEELEFYTAHASASYQHECPNPPYKSVRTKYININRTTTQAVIFRNDPRQQFILTFPGTRGREDSKLDGEYQLRPMDLYGVPKNHCGACMVHTGFREAWESIAPDVDKALTVALKKYPKYSVVIAGHSLGGAISSLATASLVALKFPIKTTWTFGQPRTGNPDYANYIDKISGVKKGSRGRTHRVVHAGDGVPHTPSTDSGYRHHSTEYWELNSHKTHNQSVGTTYRCFGQESPYCSDSITPNGVINNPHGFYSGVNMGNRYICH